MKTKIIEKTPEKKQAIKYQEQPEEWLGAYCCTTAETLHEALCHLGGPEGHRYRQMSFKQFAAECKAARPEFEDLWGVELAKKAKIEAAQAARLLPPEKPA